MTHNASGTMHRRRIVNTLVLDTNEGTVGLCLNEFPEAKVAEQAGEAPQVSQGTGQKKTSSKRTICWMHIFDIGGFASHFDVYVAISYLLSISF